MKTGTEREGREDHAKGAKKSRTGNVGCSFGDLRGIFAAFAYGSPDFKATA